MPIKTTGIGSEFRIITKTVNGEARVSCSCCVEQEGQVTCILYYGVDLMLLSGLDNIPDEIFANPIDLSSIINEPSGTAIVSGTMVLNNRTSIPVSYELMTPYGLFQVVSADGDGWRIRLDGIQAGWELPFLIGEGIDLTNKISFLEDTLMPNYTISFCNIIAQLSPNFVGSAQSFPIDLSIMFGSVLQRTSVCLWEGEEIDFDDIISDIQIEDPRTEEEDYIDYWRLSSVKIKPTLERNQLTVGDRWYLIFILSGIYNNPYEAFFSETPEAYLNVPIEYRLIMRKTNNHRDPNSVVNKYETRLLGSEIDLISGYAAL